MQTKEWTLMFYFASDNPLASTIVSQLKALKDAGFHPDANVIAHFDPHAVKTPVHIFDVNAVNKFWYPGQSQVGFVRNNPFVRDLVLDRLWEEDKIRNLVTEHVKVDPANGNEYNPGTEFNPPKPSRAMSGEQTPKEALPSFLNFCRDKYPARHYLLFILGHGQVVGNDSLLFDDNAAEHSLTLTDLGGILREFNTSVQKEQDEPGIVEMIGLHSCSMSAMEVAYELHGAANYLLASQGPSYVGSWPYKQILLRVFNDLNSRLTPDDINGTHQGVDGKETLLKKLADGGEAAALFVRGELEDDTRKALDEFKRSNETTENMIKAVVRDLNQILDGGKIARAKAFLDVGSANGITQLRNADLQGVNLRRLNRLLLAEAFPEIARYPKLSIETLLTKIFYYCVYNSFDFQLAGYPYDLCLTNLTKVPETQQPINNLADRLIDGLKDKSDPTARQLIQLAHLDAQSFYQEDYVDLYDFCFCFRKRFDQTNQLLVPGSEKDPKPNPAADFRRKVDPDSAVGRIYTECKNMIGVLEKGSEQRPEQLIVKCAFSGPAFQYSHGLSIYFPWTAPVSDEMWDSHYGEYQLAENTHWRDFLQAYFTLTERETRAEEAGEPEGDGSVSGNVLAMIGRIGAHVLAGDGRLQKPGPDHPMGRFGPDDPTGAMCNCSIKNYPAFTGKRTGKDGKRELLAVSEDMLAGHEITKDDDPNGS